MVIPDKCMYGYLGTYATHILKFNYNRQKIKYNLE